jgi:hypothetical protein
VSAGIFKASRDLNLFCEWSSVCDGPTFVGTRAEMLAYGITPDRLDRACKTGTSYLDSDHGSFDSNGLLMLNGGQSHGWLPRNRLPAYLCALLADETGELADRLLEPLEDDEAIA